MGHLRLAAHGLHAAYDGHAVLTGADLDVLPSARLALLGANGSGKTTLLRCLSGAMRPKAGRVLLDEVPLGYGRAALTRHRQQVQLVLQDPDDQLFSADVTRDVSFGPMNLGLSEAQVRDRVEEALSLLGIGDLAARPTHQLSFGQKKRVAIAGAIAMRPCVLLLDEPTAGLDPVGVEEMLTALTRLEAHGTTVLIATHDVDLALAWADSAALVVGGRVVQGDPAFVLGDPDLVTAARLRHPWVLELLTRLGGPTSPVTAGGPRDLDSLIEHLRRQPSDRPG